MERSFYKHLEICSEKDKRIARIIRLPYIGKML